MTYFVILHGTTGINLRGVASHSVDVGAELGVLDAVHLHHVRWGLVHAVVLVGQFVPRWLEPLTVATP